MEYLTLRNSARLPMVGYGTWDVRGDEGKQAILTALEVGYRLLDTAQMYENEDIVGRAIRESGLRREEIFLTSKLYRPSSSYVGARDGIEKSLNTLQTDYIDLMLIHEPYDQALEMYQALREAEAAGKLRAIGISNFNAGEYADFCRQCGEVPAVNQVEAHVYHTQLPLKEALEANGTRMQGWAPFTEGRRNIFAEPVLVEAGASHGKTAGQAALRYLVQRGIAVIPKSMHRSRMEENLDIFDFTLTAEEMARIAQLDGGRSLFGWY